MQKAPSERYQSLYATIRDFEYLSRAEQRAAPVSTFTVAMHDLRDQFHTLDLKVVIYLKTIGPICIAIISKLTFLKTNIIFHDMKLYGRDRELSRTMQFIQQFRATRDTCVVLVGGAAGVGKSTMVRKMLEAVITRHQQAPGVDGSHIMLIGIKNNKQKLVYLFITLNHRQAR